MASGRIVGGVKLVEDVSEVTAGSLSTIFGRVSGIDDTLGAYTDEEVVEHDGERRDEVGEHVGEKNDGENELTQTAGEETVVSTEL